MEEKLDLILQKLESLESGQKELSKVALDIHKRQEETDTKLDKLSEKIAVQHIENINADNLLLNEIRSIREGVVFVNRKVADAELEINLIKNGNKQ